MIRITTALLAAATCLAPASVLEESWSHQALPQPDVAVTHAFFVAGPNFTGIIDEGGKTQWGAPRAGARDGWVLPNGNIIIAWGNEVLEYRYGTHEVIWKHSVQGPNKEISTVQRLPDGMTLVTELGSAPRILEIDGAGAVKRTVVLQPGTDNVHMQTRMARKLSDGTYRVPHLLDYSVKTYRADGTVAASIATDLDEIGGRAAENWPFTAIDLPNGNVLVGCTHGNKVVEFTQAGEVAWVLRNEDVGGAIHDACGVQRLPNGNTVIASYQSSKGPKLIEVDRDKNLVWSYDGPNRAHHFQILSTNGQPLPGRPLR